MRKPVIIVIAVWVLLVGISFWWNLENAKEEQKRATFQTSRDYFKLLVLTREWNAGHGGVYVPVTDDTPPNPYLEDPLRDIQISEDLTLTKENPAFMTRQLSEIAAKKEGVKFHITSRKPIRPENEPTQWEERALEAFEGGIKEVGEFVKTQSYFSFYYMAPLRAKEECLRCHLKQGYKEGDIMGGISVSLPNVRKVVPLPMALSYTGIGFLGIGIMIFFGIRLASAYQTIHEQAVTDPLTDIANRRQFFDRILQEIRRCARENQQLALIMCDIDNFKKYNDTYGHKAGDECLKKLAHAVDDALKRPGDFCARYGGEEFVVVLPNTHLEGAVHVAELLRLSVQGLRIQHKGSPTHEFVTLSLGVAATHCSVDMSHGKLIKQADEALYKAKANGRNRVESARSI
jgi:diguanylate cyclase (GGDEF)-like protein